MRVLGIETSCDETAVCLIEAEGDFGASFKWKMLGNALISQAALHAEFGGVFPNLAKREHAKNLVPLLERALGTHARHSKSEISLPRTVLAQVLAREPELLESLIPFLKRHEKPEIDAIAVTYGPGLEPALWVGVNFAKALSAVWSASRRIPIVAVNHMEGHIVMSLMDTGDSNSHSNVLQNVGMSGKLADFEFPLLALLISGGHTELVLSKEFGTYQLIGQTRDDAAGEAFDKVARLLGLGYPGGPEVSRLAAESRRQGIPLHTPALPRPMLHASSAKGFGGPRENNFDFSFSGLKTAVRRLVEDKQVSDEDRMGLAREFEDAVTDVLVTKTLRAVDEFGANTVVVGGGVSANTYIRSCLSSQLEARNSKLLLPPPELATDNAIMIALAGYFHALKKEFAEPSELVAKGNLSLAS
ncbi:MAG: tRNA (adenosine(37)-N6)-threonylcarbamoyltransferase complex transferase subunit TsaD [bacterium]|nr:tRNA (adenosine(37)-N6)-threonylcarbamoyltransferase complex transferase subunit TsaD [bacterium]